MNGKFRVKYESNNGIGDCIMEFDSEAEAEGAISADLTTRIEEYRIMNQPGDIWYADSGIQVDCWVSGSYQYTKWKRLWKSEGGHDETT